RHSNSQLGATDGETHELTKSDFTDDVLRHRIVASGDVLRRAPRSDPRGLSVRGQRGGSATRERGDRNEKSSDGSKSNHEHFRQPPTKRRTLTRERGRCNTSFVCP